MICFYPDLGILDLAIPKEIYESFFILKFAQMIIQEYQLKIIVYDIDK